MSVSKLPSGKWRAQVWVPGKGNVSVAKIIGGPGSYATKREAKAARADAKAIIGSTRQNVTVAQFRLRWLTDPLFARPRRSTMISYEQRTKEFAETYGTVPISYVTNDTVAEWLATGRRSPSVVMTLRTMFNDAASPEAGRLVTRNPFDGIKRRPPQQVEWKLDEHRRAALDEKARLLTPPSFAAYLRFGCLTALRPSELDALRFEDIDVERGEIQVRRQYNAKTHDLTLPKYGAYVAALTQEALEVLERCPRDHESPWVFTTPGGEHYRPTNRTSYWNRVRFAAGLEDVTLNRAMRHYFAWFSLNILGMPPHIIAAQLGHKDGGRLIVRTYGHPDQAVSRERIRQAYRERSNVRSLPIRKEQSA